MSDNDATAATGKAENPGISGVTPDPTVDSHARARAEAWEMIAFASMMNVGVDWTGHPISAREIQGYTFQADFVARLVVTLQAARRAEVDRLTEEFAAEVRCSVHLAEQLREADQLLDEAVALLRRNAETITAMSDTVAELGGQLLGERPPRPVPELRPSQPDTTGQHDPKPDHATLWACYRSGQIDEGDWQRLLKDDPELALYGQRRTFAVEMPGCAPPVHVRANDIEIVHVPCNRAPEPVVVALDPLIVTHFVQPDGDFDPERPVVINGARFVPESRNRDE